MKVFLLEPDEALADSIDTYLNQLRLKMKIKKVHKGATCKFNPHQVANFSL